MVPKVMTAVLSLEEHSLLFSSMSLIMLHLLPIRASAGLECLMIIKIIIIVHLLNATI